MAKAPREISSDITGSLTPDESAALEADRNNPEPVLKPGDDGYVPPPVASLETSLQQADQQQAQAPTPTPAPTVAPTPTEAPKMVPHEALHEERERRKATEAQLATMQQRTDKILETLLAQQRQAAPAQPQPQAPALPDPNVDPAGYIIGKLQQLESGLTNVNQQTAQQTAVSQQAQQMQAIQTRAIALEHQFKSTTPDYENALAHLKGGREQELRAMGYTDPVAINQQIQQDILGIAILSAQQNTNPAEMVYNLAKGRGYQPQQAAPAMPQPTDAPQIAQPTPTAAPTPNLATVAAGQAQAAATLSGTPGTSVAKMSARDLLAMSPAEFDKFLSDPSRRREWMGD